MKTLRRRPGRMVSNEKIKEIAQYIVDNGATVRDTAKIFSSSANTISKSTIFVYMKKYLPEIDSLLAEEVDMVLEKNKNERAFRGGRATQNRWEILRNG